MEVLQEGWQRLALPDLLTAESARYLIRYLQLLFKWNQRINLIGPGTIESAVETHLLDSLAILRSCALAATLLDAGAGAGLPSIPLKLVHPELEILALEPRRKRRSFLATVVGELGIKNYHLSPLRLEQLTGQTYDWVVSRGLMAWDKWIQAGSPYIAPGGTLIIMTSSINNDTIAQTAAQEQLSMTILDEFVLPFSQRPRTIAGLRLRRPESRCED